MKARAGSMEIVPADSDCIRRKRPADYKSRSGKGKRTLNATRFAPAGRDSFIAPR